MYCRPIMYVNEALYLLINSRVTVTWSKLKVLNLIIRNKVIYLPTAYIIVFIYALTRSIGLQRNTQIIRVRVECKQFSTV